ncbi:hypothetical protein [uncultured Cellulomonas sp.]|uniref:hypothetical protein n=1 Tax=uncultured Cellulomonas sp. TaxID=189682 RepID=UPI00262BB89B|nr:hypothetical protein [uncultured Cellulomonas sp.]
MIIDCDSCTVRGAACTDCVVTFLTIPVRPSGHAPATGTATGAAARGSAANALPVDLDADERAALDVLASSGLVPPLRMVRAL